MEEGPYKISLMYVGKNPDVLSSLKAKTLDLDVVHYENGLQAIDYIRKHKDINVVIAEVALPGIEGFEMGMHLKQRLGLKNIPFVLIDFKNNPLFREKVFKNKEVFDDFYIHPFNIDKLVTRIRFLIQYLNRIEEVENKPAKTQRTYKIPFIKRLFDIFVSLFAIIILSPLFIIVAIAIKLESKGPVIFKSKRVGTGYRIFDFYKFRSMYTGSELKLKELSHLNQYKKEEKPSQFSSDQIESCPRCDALPEGEHCSPVLYIGGEEICEYWYKILKKSGNVSTFIKIENDPRITKVGKIIRNTSIDELPQLFNVLVGSMSIVGNRPLPLYEAELLTSDDWGARFMAPAGITGLWQVKLRGKGGVMSEEERKSLDNKYAETYSFIGDIKLILSTIPAMLQKQNV
ncbi:MAG: sugar transferase [Bacteroidales bacterium]|nr:sugar transferase [Bacteroidales bacterium]